MARQCLLAVCPVCQTTSLLVSTSQPGTIVCERRRPQATTCLIKRLAGCVVVSSSLWRCSCHRFVISVPFLRFLYHIYIFFLSIWVVGTFIGHCISVFNLFTGTLELIKPEGPQAHAEEMPLFSALQGSEDSLS